MPSRSPLIAFLFALGGLIFSGYMSYVNLFNNGCVASFVSCGGVELFGQPTCVYGFFMFLLTAALIIPAWRKPTAKLLSIILGLAIFGVLFSGGLTVYEYGFEKLSGVTACVYGLGFYLGITISAWVWRKKFIAASLPMVTPPTDTPPAVQ